MAEILGFRATESFTERPKRGSAFKQNILRTVTAGLFALSAYMGIKYGTDAIWDNSGQQEHQLVADDQAQEITTAMVQYQAGQVLQETLEDTRNFVLATAGFAGVAAISIGVAARRSHYAGEAEVHAQASDAEEVNPVWQPDATNYLGHHALQQPVTTVVPSYDYAAASITPAAAFRQAAQQAAPPKPAAEQFNAFRW